MIPDKHGQLGVTVKKVACQGFCVLFGMKFGAPTAGIAGLNGPLALGAPTDFTQKAPQESNMAEVAVQASGPGAPQQIRWIFNETFKNNEQLLCLFVHKETKKKKKNTKKNKQTKKQQQQQKKINK